MAWDDDRHRIAPIGGSPHSGSPVGLDVRAVNELVDPPRELAVARGRPVRDVEELLPYRLLQRRALEVELQVEAPQFAGEVGLELVDHRWHLALHRLRGRPQPAGKAQVREPVRPGYQGQWPDRALVDRPAGLPLVDGHLEVVLSGREPSQMERPAAAKCEVAARVPAS